MDKLFTPNKWFVFFCAMFIGVFVLLQYVSSQVLIDIAKSCATGVFTWDWQDKNVASRVDIKDVKVINRNGTDAVVEVSGEQYFVPFDTIIPEQKGLPGEPSKPEVVDKSKSTEHDPCKATLTLYKLQNKWVLGKVELN